MPKAPVSRPTLRCLEDDLGEALPSFAVELHAAVNHPLLEEMRRLAPDAPTGQKRVLSVKRTMVYRVRHGRWRGATWLDAKQPVFWLCAAETREEGSNDDAYEHFERLHVAGKLLPEKRDLVRLRGEEIARTVASAQKEAPRLVADARNRPGRDTPFALSGGVGGRVHASAPDELWVAVSRARASSPQWLSERVVLLVFAAFSSAAGASVEEQRVDWPDGDLAYHEIARFFV